mgnify:FL=1
MADDGGGDVVMGKTQVTLDNHDLYLPSNYLFMRLFFLLKYFSTPMRARSTSRTTMRARRTSRTTMRARRTSRLMRMICR